MDNNIRLIIPSATLVPKELQKLGKLPAVIYPVNQRIAFEYIYYQYKAYCSSIDVICYENADKVKRQLQKYNDDKIKIKTLPDLRDLGYTILFALKDISEPVIINFADTIVIDKIIDIDGDAFFFQVDYMSDMWTYFDDEKGIITNIYDKKFINENLKKKLFVGVFKIMDTTTFANCLRTALLAPNRKINSFYYALQLYSKYYPFKAIQAKKWFDIGHEDRYYTSQLEVKAREFNHISIDKDRGILRKTSDDKDKFIGEIKWYLKLPADIEYVRPRIFSYSTDYENPYISMEYYAYHTIHELFLYGDLTLPQWEDVFKRIRFLCNDFRRYTVQDKHITTSLEDMYLNKTLQRFEKIKADTRFKCFFEKPIQVNGHTYQSLDMIAKTIARVIPKMLYDVNTFSIIHGDLCFTNIMIDNNLSFVKVIDPRGKFGKYDIYGDPRYELAKLFHSVDGKYDFLIKDLFEIDFDTEDCRINYKVKDRIREYDLFQLFLDVFKEEIGENLKKIELIESLLFLSMIPLHSENIHHQMAMLGTGLEILDRVVNVKK